MKISAVEERLQRLTGLLREMDSAVLAYSGGLDSTFLLMALKLSGIRALAVTGLSPTTPAPDLEDARRMARSIGVEHRVIPTGEMEEPGFVENSPERCYHCKDVLFGTLRAIAEEEGLAFVLDGTNLDDVSDIRPGSRAARKHSVRSPLLEAGYSKDDIREASRELGLDTWLKPASACLSSRIPFGTPITSEALATVREAEGALREMGFAALRVRAHGPVALIEVPKERMAEALEAKEAIVERLRRAGFKFVGLDLEGLRSGSMNRLLE
ncbi:MAG: ATP-dependent sacrificial sulfur transferase LarE [Nitrospirota bacterium]|jgi:uncharacterized protein